MNEFFRFIVRSDSFGHLIKHLVFIGIVGFLLVLAFFYFYLPVVTSHGESITVPDIVGLEYDDLEEFLTERDLRYEINIDSGYSSEFPPLSVLKQYPEYGQKVKEKRKIYVTLNATNPPEVRMPNLVDGSLKNAEMVLESYGLMRGEIIYEPDPARNAVLDQLFEGESIQEGTPIPKGSQIDLVVGDGIGRQIFEMPDAHGLEIEEAKILILGSSLNLGEINYVDSESDLPGTVVSQSPEAGIMVKIGQRIDLWVAKPESP
ncbi:MAG: PASTA domain-containing protein [Cyclobacteriaceae bacterium]|nr:PASTA domain-containing protein [Cyclobacteriaceae bacterium]